MRYAKEQNHKPKHEVASSRAGSHFAKEKPQIISYLPAFVFIIFIFGMGIWFIFAPKSDYSSSEKRYLSEFPEVSAERVLNGKFGSDFETYFADHFPSRNTWVGFNAYYTLYTGNNGANGVYNCKDDYLINVPVSKDNKLYKNIDVIKDFKESVNIPMTVMLAPSTGYIMEDKLPMLHNSYNDNEYFNKIAADLSASDIPFVDLRQTFKQAYKDGYQLYYRTDHHWTTRGAYTAYGELCKALGTVPTPETRFTIEKTDGFYGTTYSTSGFWGTKPDTIEVWKNNFHSTQNISVNIYEGDTTKKNNSLFFPEHLQEDDKYPVFLDGNHALTEINNSAAELDETVLIIKDSFSHSLAPFLADNFKRVVLVDMRYYKNSVSELCKSYNVDKIIVLYGIDNLATDSDIPWLE